MDEVRRSGAAQREIPMTPDASAYCPNCGHLGVAQKCKLICTNPKCSVHIILACVD